MSMDKKTGLQNKAVEPEEVGVAGKVSKDQERSPDDDEDEALLEEQRDIVSNLLTSSSGSPAVLSEVKERGAKLLASIEKAAREEFGDDAVDRAHDDALKAQFDATADLAARGGDSEANRQ